MRYFAGLFYALAIAKHTSGLLDLAMTAGCVFAGTVLALFAVEAIVQRARGPEIGEPIIFTGSETGFKSKETP